MISFRKLAGISDFIQEEDKKRTIVVEFWFRHNDHVWGWDIKKSHEGKFKKSKKDPADKIITKVFLENPYLSGKDFEEFVDKIKAKIPMAERMGLQPNMTAFRSSDPNRNTIEIELKIPS